MTLPLQRMRRFVRRRVDARGPRTRVVVARLMAWLRLDPGSMRRLAAQFQVEGAYGEAMRCWHEVRRAAPFDAGVLAACLSCALDSGDVAEVRSLFLQADREMRIPPPHVIWLAGELACRDYPAEAAQVLSSWLDAFGDTRTVCAHLPSLVSGLVGPDIAELPQKLRAPSAAGDGVYARVELARLCFAFGNIGTAARLYCKVSSGLQLPWLDQVAMWYGSARSDTMPSVGAGDREILAEQAGTNPDALMALAYTAVMDGQMAWAAASVGKALQLKYASSPHLGEVVRDCAAILDVLVRLKSRTLNLPDIVLEPGDPPPQPLPKLFVCGFGWSGSGAVYDAVRGHAGFCEFEGAGQDDILNEDSDTEATFIQSYAGLGDLWMKLRSGQSVSWQVLWDLFRCHVAGLCPTGYSEYKSAAAAANHARKYGTQYTGVFRKFFAEFAALLDSPRRGDLHGLLNRTTEALCRMLVQHTGADVVLFNNAVFGRNVVMLEIFAGHRAAIVYRDPRDVFVDRRNNDKNHWRTPRQMADFYGKGLESYLAYKARVSAPVAAGLREISFERFVGDAAFRERVCKWLVRGAGPRGNDIYFDAQASSRNAGIYRDVLDAGDQRHLLDSVATYRRMDRLAVATWDEGSG